MRINVTKIVLEFLPLTSNSYRTIILKNTNINKNEKYTHNVHPFHHMYHHPSPYIRNTINPKIIRYIRRTSTVSLNPGLQATTKWSEIRWNSRSRFYSNFFSVSNSHPMGRVDKGRRRPWAMGLYNGVNVRFYWYLHNPVVNFETILSQITTNAIRFGLQSLG